MAAFLVVVGLTGQPARLRYGAGARFRAPALRCAADRCGAARSRGSGVSGRGAVPRGRVTLWPTPESLTRGEPAKSELDVSGFRNRLSRDTAATRAGEGQDARPRAAPNRSQSPPASRSSPGRRAARPRRPQCALLQQSGRRRRAHDEGRAENLRRIPGAPRRRRFRHDPIGHRHRQKTPTNQAPETNPQSEP